MICVRAFECYICDTDHDSEMRVAHKSVSISTNCHLNGGDAVYNSIH